jgi:hypothetical protein
MLSHSANRLAAALVVAHPSAIDEPAKPRSATQMVPEFLTSSGPQCRLDTARGFPAIFSPRGR